VRVEVLKVWEHCFLVEMGWRQQWRAWRLGGCMVASDRCGRDESRWIRRMHGVMKPWCMRRGKFRVASHVNGCYRPCKCILKCMIHSQNRTWYQNKTNIPCLDLQNLVFGLCVPSPFFLFSSPFHSYILPLIIFFNWYLKNQ